MQLFTFPVKMGALDIKSESKYSLAVTVKYQKNERKVSQNLRKNSFREQKRVGCSANSGNQVTE